MKNSIIWVKYNSNIVSQQCYLRLPTLLLVINFWITENKIDFVSYQYCVFQSLPLDYFDK